MLRETLLIKLESRDGLRVIPADFDVGYIIFMRQEYHILVSGAF